jgi:hypothetical protein
MPLFGRRRDKTPPGPVWAGGASSGQFVMPPGWQPVTGRPFGGRLADPVHEITRTMYGVPRSQQQNRTVGSTTFADIFRTSVDGREVTVATARTYIEPGLFPSGHGTPAVAVCAAELPSVLPFMSIVPRQYARAAIPGMSPAIDPAFDDRFQVTGMPTVLAEVTGLATVAAAVTPEVRQRIMARDDWAFLTDGYLICCVTKGAFGSADEAAGRVSQLLGIIAAIPAAVMPDHVSHDADDLVRRFGEVDGMDGAIALLERLTPDERERLARSGTVLAAFADVRTPQEAIARFESLDARRRMEIITMFMRAEDS